MIISFKLIVYNLIFILKFSFKSKGHEKIDIKKSDLASSIKNSSRFWSKAYREIYSNLKIYNNFYFINFPYIYMTMVYSNKINISIEKREVLNTNSFKVINKNQNKFDIDIKNKAYGNIIHQLYNLNQLLNLSKKYKKNFKFKNVLEIGAGYGSLYKIFNILYPTSNYHIYDSKIMNKIQKFYITKSNILDSPIFLSEKSLHRLVTKKFDLFVALWSISEMPIKNRRIFEKIILNSKYSLIGFQKNFFEIDNKKYFESFLIKNNIKNYRIFNPEHYKDNSYLVISL